MNPVPAIIAAACALVALGGCSSSKKASAESASAAPTVVRDLGAARTDTKPVQALPRAVIYKTNGDYNANVPVQLGADGQILSYPAPSDISAERSEPLPLAEGFLLDRRGLSARSVFTRYTYAEYAALPQAPTPAELKAAIIPGARITEMLTAPMTPSEAAADTAALNALIRAHSPELTPVNLSTARFQATVRQ